MKAILVSSLAVAAVAASGAKPRVVPVQLQSRAVVARQIFQASPDDFEGVSPECKDAIETALEAMPAEPTEFVSYSESFYETAERTATATRADCAWITALPEEAADLVWDYQISLQEWATDSDNLDVVMDLGMKCMDDLAGGGLEGGLQGQEAFCEKEWTEFIMDNVPEPGEGSPGAGGDGDDGDDPIFTTPTRTGSSGPQRTGGSGSGAEEGGEEGEEEAEEEGSSPDGAEGAASGFGVQFSAIAALLVTIVGGAALL